MNLESKKHKYYISDLTLFRRVKAYVEGADQPTKIDKDTMIEDFRLRFKEYNRRQKSAFRNQILRIYKVVCETLSEEEEEILRNSEVGEIGLPDTSINSSPVSNLCDDDTQASPKDIEDGESGGDINMEGELSAGEGDEEMEELPEEGGSVGNDDEDIDDGNEDSLDDVEIEHESSMQRRPPLSYMQSLQNMTNSLSQQKKPISITISSDEEPEDPSKRYPNIFMRNGAVNIQRINDARHHRNPHNVSPQEAFHQQRMVYQQRALRTKPAKRANDDYNFPMPKRHKKLNDICAIPNVSFKLFGGFSKILQTVSELVVHIKESEIYKTLGVRPPRGFLLHGPPGCGKTLLAQAIAGELEVPMIRLAGPELVAGVSGESEFRIRELFESALEQAPCLLFIDEIDAICPPRDTARREMERRIVAQFLTCIDALGEAEAGDKVVIIGATNRPDSLDPALRRAGRFDREVCLGIPDRSARKEILEVITKDMKLKPGLDIETLSAATPGFVGADLKALTSEAAIAAVNRCLKFEKKLESRNSSTNEKIGESLVNGNESSEKEMVTEKEADPEKQITKSEEKNSVSTSNDHEAVYLSLLKSKGPLLSPEQLSNLYVEMEDFQKALKSVQPSAKREGFATVPDVTWDDIGSLKGVRDELEKSIMMPVKYPKEFALLGISAPTGILLCGPPGCGKTLLAKAVANEANINFISVKGPELLNMYVGESERAVRQCFQRARNSHPCVIFFDEIDALCPKRGASADGSNATSRVVNQVLTEMDGIEGRAGVFLMAATNRPDMVDPAVLRPGRLDKILFVDLPSTTDRSDILRALTKNGTKPPMKDVNLDEIGCDSRLEGFTGADLAALIKEASLLALTEYIRDKDEKQLFVTSEMIYQASSRIRPSVTKMERLHYEKLKILYGMPSSSNSATDIGPN